MFNRQVIETGILRITFILLVPKRLFDGTKLPLFLHCFWLLLISLTTVQPIQVIIIISIYYLSSIVLWSFSYHIWVVDCWPVCSHWLDQNSLILKSFLICLRKFSVGRIQNRHTDFPPSQVCERSWRGWGLGVQTCPLQLIALLDTKSTPSSLCKPSFVDCWILLLPIPKAQIEPKYMMTSRTCA